MDHILSFAHRLKSMPQKERIAQWNLFMKVLSEWAHKEDFDFMRWLGQLEEKNQIPHLWDNEMTESLDFIIKAVPLLCAYVGFNQNKDGENFAKLINNFFIRIANGQKDPIQFITKVENVRNRFTEQHNRWRDMVLWDILNRYPHVVGFRVFRGEHAFASTYKFFQPNEYWSLDYQYTGGYGDRTITAMIPIDYFAWVYYHLEHVGPYSDELEATTYTTERDQIVFIEIAPYLRDREKGIVDIDDQTRWREEFLSPEFVVKQQKLFEQWQRLLRIAA